MLNKKHILMEGLIYPAFLGTFMVSLVSESLNPQVMELFDYVKSISLLALFGVFYLETAVCPPERYGVHALLLNILEIVLMTVNFALVGPFRAGILKQYDEYLATTLFKWTGFFLLNAVLFWLLEFYRRKFLSPKQFPTRVIACVKYISFATVVVTLWFFVEWRKLLRWSVDLAKFGLAKLVVFAKEYIPLDMFDRFHPAAPNFSSRTYRVFFSNTHS